MLIVVLVLTILRIHGSSIGMYNLYLYGPTYEDPDLIYGNPEGVRSDEWLVATPYIISQAQNGYPRINRDIGYAQDMSVIANVPYREWSISFKPQNLPFFFLPVENAFALQWWFTAYLLIIGCYLFVLQIAPHRKGFAILLSLALFCSPFVQWWYLPNTLLSIAFPLLALVVYMRLLDAKKALPRLGFALLLTYLLTSFVLIMYPPFQIACAIAASLFASGYLIEHIKERRLQPATLVHIAGAIVLAGLLAAVFFLTRLDIVRTVANTAYPGGREASGGDYGPLFLLFSTHLLPLVQSPLHASQYFSNQSEVSNFLFFSPFLIVPSASIFFHDLRSGRRVDFPLLFVSFGIILFTFRIMIRGGNWFYSLLLLHKVPGTRLLIGLGLLGFLQLALLFRRHISATWEQGRVLPWSIAGTAFIVFLVAAFEARERYPGFVSNPLTISTLSLAISSMVFLYMKKRFLLGTLVLLLFSIASVFQIHPVYRGLRPLLNSDLGQQLREIGDHDGAWVVLQELVFEHQPMQQGLRSFSGVYAYPQVGIWRLLDRSARREHIYNRYAHVTFWRELKSLKLFQPDHFGAPFDGCSRFVRRHRIRHVLSPKKVLDDCLTLERVVHYPTRDFFIYRVN